MCVNTGSVAYPLYPSLRCAAVSIWVSSVIIVNVACVSCYRKLFWHRERHPRGFEQAPPLSFLWARGGVATQTDSRSVSLVHVAVGATDGANNARVPIGPNLPH